MQVSSVYLPVYVDRARWGCRRLRVTECATVLTAELVYDWLLDRDVCAPGWSGTVLCRASGIPLRCRVVVLPNALWKAGRVFLICDLCNRRCTRLYQPTTALPLACRRCWGLTYDSTQKGNYKLAAGTGKSLSSAILLRVLESRRTKQTRRAEGLARAHARRAARKRREAGG